MRLFSEVIKRCNSPQSLYIISSHICLHFLATAVRVKQHQLVGYRFITSEIRRFSWSPHVAPSYIATASVDAQQTFPKDCTMCTILQLTRPKTVTEAGSTVKETIYC